MIKSKVPYKSISESENMKHFIARVCRHRGCSVVE